MGKGSVRRWAAPSQRTPPILGAHRPLSRSRGAQVLASPRWRWLWGVEPTRFEPSRAVASLAFDPGRAPAPGLGGSNGGA